MKVLTLSGWGQPHESLTHLMPGSASLDYADYEHANDAIAAIAQVGGDAELVIGWSLGGQLAARAIAQGLMKPQKLVLIAAPFQFVHRPQLPLGMKRDFYDKFRHNYAKNPERTLHKSWELVAFDDAKADTVREHLAKQDKTAMLEKNWLRWLDELENYSCVALDFSAFPKTLIIQGERDAVVSADQSRRFAGEIRNSQLKLIKECGHAPHWHDAELIAGLITEHAHV